MSQNKELDKYRQATWDFILEHCDVLESGVLFVKFHTSCRYDIEERIKSRVRGYHRENVQAKQKLHEERVNKLQKREKYQAEKKKRKTWWGQLKIKIKKHAQIFFHF